MDSHYVFIFGTRPECIKMAALILEAQRQNLKFTVISTGQHAQMMQPILDYFKIKPDFDLKVMKPGQSLNDISFALMKDLRPILSQINPSHILVQGDTTTAAIAALIGFYEKIKVVHIEAGLRTHDLKSPWPEEFNRRLIGLTSDLHFTPTEHASTNLKAEKYPAENIFCVGNTGIDALRIVSEKIKNLNALKTENNFFNILVTLHRRENFGSEIENVMLALKNILVKHNTVKIKWPLHQNPNVKLAFEKVFSEKQDRLNVVEPLGYFEFITEMLNCDLIVTDSGGIQEEAPFLGKPVLVCRTNTERPEAIECGSAKLVGTKTQNITQEIEKLLPKGTEYQNMSIKRTPFGDGFSAEKIFSILQRSV